MWQSLTNFGKEMAISTTLHDDSKRQFGVILKSIEEDGRYAEVRVTEGHIPFVLDCFSAGPAHNTSN